MEVHVAESISKVAAEDWDKLADPNNPFVTHRFLQALEDSNSVGENAGWVPLHLLVQEEGELVAAVPTYLKDNSYGEYIFDWGWAEASERARIPYYPKLVSAVPYTPATGPRILTRQHNPFLVNIAWKGMLSLAEATQANSVHFLFVPESQHQQLAQQKDVIPRLTHQFHRQNPNVEDFTEWLGLFTAKERKKTKRERKKAAASIDKIYHLHGSELTEKHIDDIWRFYQNTCMRKWGRPYLQRGFFDCLRTTLADLTIVFIAEKDGQIVATSLSFQSGNHLYGRYWGCRESFDTLHFELCYHQQIELCIKKGWTRFEAGAQGQHKLKRGLLPQPTYSNHWLRHTGLSAAVADAMQRERKYLLQEMEALRQHSPFRAEAMENAR